MANRLVGTKWLITAFSHHMTTSLMVSWNTQPTEDIWVTLAKTNTHPTEDVWVPLAKTSTQPTEDVWVPLAKPSPAEMCAAADKHIDNRNNTKSGIN